MKKSIFKAVMIAASIFILIVLSSVVNVSASTVTRVKLDKKGVIIYEGNTVRLTANVKAQKSSDKTVKWSSTDSSVATVDSDGEIKAVKAGTAFIKATSKVDKKLYAKCKVTVLIDDSKDVKFDIINRRGDDGFILPGRIIRNYNGIQKIMQQLKSNYYYDANSSEYKPFIKKLKRYDKSFFNNNVLYLGTYTTSYGTFLKTGAVERVAKSDGKYRLRLNVTDKYSEPADYPAISDSYCMFAEIPKSIANTIDQVQVRYDGSHGFLKDKYEKPVIQKVSSPSPGKVKLKLSTSGSVGIYMLIYRSTSKDGKYTRIGKLDVDSSTMYFTDSGLKSGKVYYYRIRGYNGYGMDYGIYSNKVSVKVS